MQLQKHRASSEDSRRKSQIFSIEALLNKSSRTRNIERTPLTSSAVAATGSNLSILWSLNTIQLQNRNPELRILTPDYYHANILEFWNNVLK